jgi:hypothetical protein
MYCLCVCVCVCVYYAHDPTFDKRILIRRLGTGLTRWKTKSSVHLLPPDYNNDIIIELILAI